MQFFAECVCGGSGGVEVVEHLLSQQAVVEVEGAVHGQGVGVEEVVEREREGGRFGNVGFTHVFLQMFKEL